MAEIDALSRKTPRVLAALREGQWLTPSRLKFYPRLFLAGYALAIAIYLAMSNGMIDPNGKPVGTDFVNVYAAGEMAREGHASAVYDWAEHRKIEQREFGGRDIPYYGWHYPPLFLLVAAPLSALPYGIALVVYLAVTFAAFAAVMWRLVKPNRDALIIAIAYPAVFICALHGQNGFLTAALLGAGLIFLERNPWLAGVFLGALAYKPQFAALALFMILIVGRWRAFASAAATVTALVLATIIFFGFETWQAFLASEPLTRSVVLEAGSTGWEKIQSVFASVRMLGGGVPLAYAIQLAAALAAVAATIWAWRRNISQSMKYAVLCLAIPFTTPYLLDYDLVFLALPLAWIALEGRATGFLPWEKFLLLALWVLPLVARSVGALHFPLAPVVIALTLAITLRRAREFLTRGATHA